MTRKWIYPVLLTGLFILLLQLSLPAGCVYGCLLYTSRCV